MRRSQPESLSCCIARFKIFATTLSLSFLLFQSMSFAFSESSDDVLADYSDQVEETKTPRDRCEAGAWEGKGGIHGKVSNVVDGDTIRIQVRDKSYSIRMLTIDTPETHYRGMSQGRWAEAASAHLKKLLSVGDSVFIEFDEEHCDSYGRVLGHVWKDKVNINRKMVADGFAVNYCIYPNTKRCQEYSWVANKNFRARKGIFGPTGPEIPYEWRRETSGRPYEKPVTHIYSLRVLQPHRVSQVSIPYRMFFMKVEDIEAPYYLEPSLHY